MIHFNTQITHAVKNLHLHANCLIFGIVNPLLNETLLTSASLLLTQPLNLTKSVLHTNKTKQLASYV